MTSRSLVLVIFSTSLLASIASCTGQSTNPIGTCLTPLRPYTAECSGHGICSNGTCVCEPGWSGLGLFLDRRGGDCNTHDLAFKICQSIGYGAHILASFVALGKILRLGKLLVCIPKSKVSTSQRGLRKAQMLVVSHLSVSLCLAFQFAVFALGSLYVSMSVLATVAIILTSVAQTVDVAIQATFFITASISSIHVTKASAAKRRLLVMVFIQQALTVCAWIICMIGIYAGPKDYQLGFFYGVTISVLILQIIPPFFHAKFLGDALTAIDEHTQTNKVLNNREDLNTELLSRVRAKIAKARGNSVGPAVVAGIVILCVIVMPLLASYMVSLMWALTALRLTADNIIYSPDS